MRLPPPAAFLLAALTGACASSAGPAGFVVPDGPVTWPSGRYVVSGRMEARVTTSAASGLGSAEHVQVELYVSPEGELHPRTGYGACQELARERPGRRSFRCGRLGLSLETDGTRIRGWATLPLTVTARTGTHRCVEWRTDSSGNRTCARTEQETTTRTVIGRGELSVTSVR